CTLLSCPFSFSSSLSHRYLPSFPTRRSSDLLFEIAEILTGPVDAEHPKRCDTQAFPRCEPEQVFGRELRQAVVGNRHRGARVFIDRKSTRLNSSHVAISYAVFCLKKKKYQSSSIRPADIQLASSAPIPNLTDPLPGSSSSASRDYTAIVARS